MKHDKGLIEINIDALVMPRQMRDDEAATSLLILLKQQLTELDKLQPRSRRSGRC